MLYELAYVEFATCGVRLLTVLAFVTIASYAARSRLMFLVGTLGCFVCLIIPEPNIRPTYASHYDACLGNITATADHMVTWGVAGAVIGCAMVLLTMAVKTLRMSQFSMRAILTHLAARIQPHWHLALLVVAHLSFNVLWIAISATFGGRINSNIMENFTPILNITLDSQICLLAIWLTFGKSRFPIRLRCVILGVFVLACWCSASITLMVSGLWGPLGVGSFCENLPSLAKYGFVHLIPLASALACLRLANVHLTTFDTCALDANVSRGIQFSMSQLLTIVFVVALVVAVGNYAGQSLDALSGFSSDLKLPVSRYLLIELIHSALTIVEIITFTLLSLWAVLTIKQPFARFWIALTIGVAFGFAVHSLWNESWIEILKRSAKFLGHIVILAISLLVVRTAGYRLVRMNGLEE